MFRVCSSSAGEFDSFVMSPGAAQGKVVYRFARIAPRLGPEMPEKISPETRSRMMAGIRGRDTEPERLVRRYLHNEGLRFRICRKDLAGKPDIVLPRWNTIVFVHGCFWHGHHSCKLFRVPKTRTEFWLGKITRNAQRDQSAIQTLLAGNWRVAVIWECALRADAPGALASLLHFIRNSERLIEIAAVGKPTRAVDE